jgi:N6-L-threonylcarbamoyladenine synthase
MSSGLVLGIESSCDDTAVAVVDSGGQVLSSIVATQVEIHSPYGGVFPEFASRAHIASIIPAVKQALAQANITKDSLRAIGVTRGPGLIGSLSVGLNTAAGLGMAWNLPVIGVNHLRGHLRSADLEQERVTYPALILLVSGGHTFLAHMVSPLAEIELLGSTRDDSVGESYDKVSRMLGLGYPGGPIVDRLAMQGTASIPFPRPMIDKGLDFSFSGLKSAVSRYLAATRSPKPEDVAASFVQAVMETLVKKCRRALAMRPSKSLVIVGGVAASPQLRAQGDQLCGELGIELCLPPLKWSTDNAAMIGLVTWDYIKLDKYIKPETQLNLLISDY